jgi:hypothetical protein
MPLCELHQALEVLRSQAEPVGPPKRGANAMSMRQSHVQELKAVG